MEKKQYKGHIVFKCNTYVKHTLVQPGDYHYKVTNITYIKHNITAIYEHTHNTHTHTTHTHIPTNLGLGVRLVPFPPCVSWDRVPTVN